MHFSFWEEISVKVEYSYHGKAPILIIKGTEFISAIKDDEEFYLLEIAINGFGANFGITAHFDKRVNDTIQQWLSKAGDVIYAIKEKWAGRTLLNTWCEVYVRNGNRFIEIVVSDNGRDYSLHEKDE